MLITKENIKELQKEQEIYVLIGWFQIPRKGMFLGKFGVNYLFSFDSVTITIYENNIENNDYIRMKQLYTTYESVCIGFREKCIDAINHYNSHQLKNNPINVNN